MGKSGYFAGYALVVTRLPVLLMRRLILFVLALSLSAVLHGQSSLTGSASLSGSVVFGSTTTCYGNCGNPYASYPGGVMPDESSWTAIASCIGALTPSTNYYLSGDVGSTPSANCLQVRNQTVDLRGHTLTGTIRWDSNQNVSGLTIFNGAVNCNLADGTYYGCIEVVDGSPLSADCTLHHLTVDNAADPGTGAVRSIHAESDGTAAPSTAKFYIYHDTIVVETAATSSRAIAINLTTNDNVEAAWNLLTCSTNASACQGIQLIPTRTDSGSFLLHDNEILLNSSPSMPQSARGIALSGPDSSTTGPAGFLVYNNLCTANTNRCFRARQVTGATFQNNIVYNCADTDAGCYHMGDPSGPSNVTNLGVTITHERIAMNGGTAFYTRNAQGILFDLSTVTGTSGRLADVTYYAPIGAPNTVAEVCGITGASGLGTASNVDTGATANVLNSGTWSGTGIINSIGSCP